MNTNCARFALFVVISILIATTAHCAATNEFKWIQNPDTEWGYDIWSWGYEDVAGNIMIVNEVADDWVCRDGRPITEVRWWGSFNNWMPALLLSTFRYRTLLTYRSISF